MTKDNRTIKQQTHTQERVCYVANKEEFAQVITLNQRAQN